MSRFKYGWKPDLPDFRDFKYAAVRPPVTFPPIVDLRSQCSAVENQLQIGSCTANALAGNLEFIHPDFQASRLFIYYNERVLEGTVASDVGANLRDGIKALVNMGVCSEKLWPYVPAEFSVKPYQSCYEAALQGVITSYHRLNGKNDWLNCLVEGFPFVFGFTVYDNFETDEVAKSGILEMPTNRDSIIGGHAVCAVGYNLADQTLLVRNSWGADWGMGGYFTMPFEYAEEMADDFWTIRK